MRIPTSLILSPRHEAENLEAKRSHAYSWMVEQGMIHHCVRCGEPARPYSDHCTSCLKKLREESRHD